MPVVGVGKTAIIGVVFSLFLLLLGSLSCLVFASSENWVEVVRFTGGGSIFGATPPFAIDHVEWRIRWEYVPLFPFGSQTDFDFWVVPEENRIEGHFSSDMGIAGVNGPVEKNGTLYFPDLNGTFYLHTAPGSSEWTIIIEQNIDSIPEFPSWTPMLLILIVLAVAIAIYKRRLPKKLKTQNSPLILRQSAASVSPPDGSVFGCLCGVCGEMEPVNKTRFVSFIHQRLFAGGTVPLKHTSQNFQVFF